MFPSRAANRITAPRKTTGRQYRTVPELLEAVRHEHLISQDEFAAAASVSRAQMCRYEKGRAEPSVRTLRRIMEAAELRLTFGVEPLTAEVDEQFQALADPWDAMDFDLQLSVGTSVWAAVEAGVPLVVGGTFAAAVQGVPAANQSMLVHLLTDALDDFLDVCERGHWGAVDRGPGRYLMYHFDNEFDVVLRDELPVNTSVRVPRSLSSDQLIEVRVVPLADLLAADVLDPMARACAERILRG